MQDIIIILFSAIYVKNFSAATDTLIKLKQQYQFTIWCKMEFSDYPFDEQVTCRHIFSYQHVTRYIGFERSFNNKTTCTSGI